MMIKFASDLISQISAKHF